MAKRSERIAFCNNLIVAIQTRLTEQDDLSRAFEDFIFNWLKDENYQSSESWIREIVLAILMLSSINNPIRKKVDSYSLNVKLTSKDVDVVNHPIVKRFRFILHCLAEAVNLSSRTWHKRNPKAMGIRWRRDYWFPEEEFDFKLVEDYDCKPTKICSNCNTPFQDHIFTTSIAVEKYWTGCSSCDERADTKMIQLIDCHPHPEDTLSILVIVPRMKKKLMREKFKAKSHGPNDIWVEVDIKVDAVDD